MSIQEKYITTLEKQVAELTKDCYYLLSLISTDGGINTQEWPEGRKIVEDLDRSTAIFQSLRNRNRRNAELDAERARQEKARIEAENRRNKRIADEKKLTELQDLAAKHLQEISDHLNRIRMEIKAESAQQ